VDSTVFQTLFLTFLRALPVRHRRTLFYVGAHGRLPNVRRPQSFNEKVNWRILNDRRNIFADTCDKVAMKEFAQSRVGGTVRIPKTLWSGTDLAELVGMVLPQWWVLKPNHRSNARVHLGEGEPDVAALAVLTEGWLDEVNWSMNGEWAYSLARRQFLVEEMIGDSRQVPADIRFFVFDGVVELIQVDSGRFGEHTRNFYTSDWEPLTLASTKFPRGAVAPAPECLGAMKEAAVAIADGFDFLRVDLYHHDGEVWFGETTPYPASALTVFDPPSFDRELGGKWTLAVR
jgi:hypothetical protein